MNPSKDGRCLIEGSVDVKKHAYLIMAYNEFHMLHKLLTELDDERNDIFVHIDKKTKNVDLNEITSWVKTSKLVFIKRMNVYWGHLSIVKCELKLLQEATKGRYHYYHLLSGADFPLKTQDEIHSLLEHEDGEFISCHTNGEGGDFFLYKLKYYYPLIRFVGKGYFSGRGIKNRILRRLGYWQMDLQNFQERIGIDRLDGSFVNYKGDQWFSITHDFAGYILANRRQILRRYRLTSGPDEFFIPTLAMHSDFADRVRNNSLREIDWKRGTPYEYTIDDLNMLKNSKALFARKISYDNDPALVDALIEHLHAATH